jgi:hypothetical protein
VLIEASLFFFEKKNQKTFANWPRSILEGPQPDLPAIMDRRVAFAGAA